MAAKQQDVGALLTKQLGKEVGDALMAKMDEMARKGATPAAIEKAIAADLVAHIEKEVTAAVITKIGPITPIKVKPIQVDIKAKITPITITPKINTGVQVKVGPGIIARGAK